MMILKSKRDQNLLLSKTTEFILNTENSVQNPFSRFYILDHKNNGNEEHFTKYINFICRMLSTQRTSEAFIGELTNKCSYVTIKIVFVPDRNINCIDDF